MSGCRNFKSFQLTEDNIMIYRMKEAEKGTRLATISLCSGLTALNGFKPFVHSDFLDLLWELFFPNNVLVQGDVTCSGVI